MMNRLMWSSLLSLTVALVAGPVVAGQDSNFGTLTLGGGKASASANGNTGGTTSLPAIVSNRDRNDNSCLGFADPTPDHILLLKNDFAKLQLRVNSGGDDTTLIVQGPGGVLCGDDTGSSKDASLSANGWKAGSYRVWVGNAAPGSRRDYTLVVTGTP